MKIKNKMKQKKRKELKFDIDIYSENYQKLNQRDKKIIFDWLKDVLKLVDFKY